MSRNKGNGRHGSVLKDNQLYYVKLPGVCKLHDVAQVRAHKLFLEHTEYFTVISSWEKRLLLLLFVLLPFEGTERLMTGVKY